MRLHGNLGEPDVSTSNIPGWSGRVNKLQARSIECTRWHRERNQGRVLQLVSRIEGNEALSINRAEMDVRSHSVLIVPSEIGDLSGSTRPAEAYSEGLGHGDSTDRALFSRKWATFEDKILQRAIVMLLEPIYEQDFHDGSYATIHYTGRPKRSPHHAMDALWKETRRIGGGWILEVDLRKPRCQ